MRICKWFMLATWAWASCAVALTTNSEWCPADEDWVLIRSTVALEARRTSAGDVLVRPPTERTYVVSEPQSFVGIATSQFHVPRDGPGASLYVPLLEYVRALNPGVDLDSLRPGQQILLPDSPPFVSPNEAGKEGALGLSAVHPPLSVGAERVDESLVFDCRRRAFHGEPTFWPKGVEGPRSFLQWRWIPRAEALCALQSGRLHAQDVVSNLVPVRFAANGPANSYEPANLREDVGFVRARANKLPALRARPVLYVLDDALPSGEDALHARNFFRDAIAAVRAHYGLSRRFARGTVIGLTPGGRLRVSGTARMRDLSVTSLSNTTQQARHEIPSTLLKWYMSRSLSTATTIHTAYYKKSFNSPRKPERKGPHECFILGTGSR